MRNLYIALACISIPAAFAGCTQDDILYDVDYNVTLDPGNTYVAGDPVTFKFTGEVDNILFYSGESGSEYRYRDRFTVDMDAVESAVLTLEIYPQYGNFNDGLDIYYTTSFDGLDRYDAEADKALLQSLETSGMSGWTELEWEEKSGSVTTVEMDISEMKKNFCLAFHWHPQGDPAEDIQRTYSVSGTLATTIRDYGTIETDLGEFLFTTVMMNEELADDPYVNNNGNGSIRFDDSTYDIKFQGVSDGVLDYSLDGWCVSVPQDLNSVPNDEGTVIKNMQNYMSSYSYTYEEPGTYQAVFVGRNANYLGSSEEVKQFQVTILSRPVGSETE